MKNTDCRILYIAIFSLLFGCTNSKPVNQATIPAEEINVHHRATVAHEAFKSQDYHKALVQWKILNTIDPENAEFKNRIRVLEALIKRRTKLHLNSGKEALENNQLATAEMEFLKVLALNPDDKFALQMLQQIDIKRSEARQERKTTKLIEKKSLAPQQENDENSQENAYLELGINYFEQSDWSSSIREISKYLASNPQDETARDYLFKAHVKLSEIFESRGHFEPAIQHMEDAFTTTKLENTEQHDRLVSLRIKLASEFFNEGVKVYRDDIAQAILLWQRASKYDPENQDIQNRLKNAIENQKRLKEINR